MRCLNCNVDIADYETVCPLCNSSAAKEEPLLSNIKFQQYPEYKKPGENATQDDYKRDFPHKLIYSVFILLSIICFGLGKCLNEYFLTIALPVMLALPSLLFFLYGLKEKGRLLHSALSILLQTFSALVFLIIILFGKTAIVQLSISFCVCLILTLILLLFRPKRFVQQLQAFFKI